MGMQVPECHGCPMGSMTPWVLDRSELVNASHMERGNELSCSQCVNTAGDCILDRIVRPIIESSFLFSRDEKLSLGLTLRSLSYSTFEREITFFYMRFINRYVLKHTNRLLHKNLILEKYNVEIKSLLSVIIDLNPINNVHKHRLFSRTLVLLILYNYIENVNSSNLSIIFAKGDS